MFCSFHYDEILCLKNNGVKWTYLSAGITNMVSGYRLWHSLQCRTHAGRHRHQCVQQVKMHTTGRSRVVGYVYPADCPTIQHQVCGSVQ